MKVKRRRDDFVVREVSHCPLNGGPFAAYCLEKSGIGTQESVDRIARLWKLSRKDVQYAGLKDRHAVTSQTITVYSGPPTNLEEESFSLTYLGQTKNAISAAHLTGNDFRIQLRDLSNEQAGRMCDALASDAWCTPNYFDRQRFGSVCQNEQFVAQPWCLGDYERALYLALAEFNPNSPPAEREQREIVRDHWRDWQACKDRLDRSNARSVITYLVDHPEGFKKAAALIQRDLRSLYVSAFQSRLWNEVASQKIRTIFSASELNEMTDVTGCLVFPTKGLNPTRLTELSEVSIPLPSGRQTKWSSDVGALVEQAAAKYGLKIHQLRFKHPRDVFFSRANRRLLLDCNDLNVSMHPDELSQSGKQKLVLEFRLAPGQYATMLLKSLDLVSAGSQASLD